VNRVFWDVSALIFGIGRRSVCCLYAERLGDQSVIARSNRPSRPARAPAFWLYEEALAASAVGRDRSISLLSTYHAIDIVGAITDRDVKRAERLVARNAQFLTLEWEKLHARR